MIVDYFGILFIDFQIYSGYLFISYLSPILWTKNIYQHFEISWVFLVVLLVPEKSLAVFVDLSIFHAIL